MRVLIINNYYYPNLIGGAEHSVKLLAEGLSDTGVDVTIYSRDGETRFDQKIINGVKVFRSQSPHPINSIVSYYYRLKDLALKRHLYEDLDFLLSEVHPDIVHINNFGFKTPSVWKYFSEQEIAVVHTLRDTALYAPIIIKNNLTSRILRSALFIIIYRTIMRYYSSHYVTGITAPSEYMTDKFLTNGYFKNSKVSVIPNAIILDFEETKRIISEKLSRTDKRINFLYVGGLTKHKGILNLLCAMESLCDANITLTICGSGPLELIVVDKCSSDKRIRYLGQLTDAELKEEYIVADVLIIPSIWEEAFGRVIIEGHQYGLPVLGSNRGAIPSLLKDTGGGIIFQFDSVVDLTESMSKFMNREFIKSFLPEIQQNIMRYHNDKITMDFYRFYLELIHDT